MKTAKVLFGVFAALMLPSLSASQIIRTISSSGGFGNVQMQAGDSLCVRLFASTGTNFRWVLMQSDNSMLRFDHSNVHPGPATMPGARGVQEFWFTAIRPGTTNASFGLVSQTAGYDDPMTTFNLTVQVSGGTPIPPAQMVLRDYDNGRDNVRFQVGQLVEVRLSSNASTGFGWQATTVPTELLQPIGQPRYISAMTGLMGSGGTMIFRYRVIGSGGGILKFTYQRSDGEIGQEWQVIFSIPRP